MPDKLWAEEEHQPMREKHWVLPGPPGSITQPCGTGRPAIASFSSPAWGEGGLPYSIP